MNAHESLKSVIFVAICVSASVFPASLVAAPAATEVAKLIASDAVPLAQLGFSASISGDTAVVGAMYDDTGHGGNGAAYVFVNNGTNWVEQAKLTASDGEAFDEFGVSVAISDDTVVVGAWRDHETDDYDEYIGAAYVFVRSNETWTEQAKLVPSDSIVDHHFGYRVAIDGDTIVVGAFGDNHAGVHSGAAYVFTRSGTTWSEQAKLTAGDAVTGHMFGLSVAVDGDTAAIGTWGDDHAGQYSGAAYVFTRSGVAWSEQVKLTASDAAASDSFGISAAISGDTVVIGASDNDDIGAAYVFTRFGTTWTEQAKLAASDPMQYDGFGSEVAISGDTAVISCMSCDDVGLNSGAAYLFTRAGMSWTEQEKLMASDAVAGQNFGWSVAVNVDTVIVGAKFDDDGGENAGAAYVFSLGTQVEIDIKPGSGTNPISLRSRGKVPVAILTTDSFDATQVDWETVRFGPGAASESHGRSHVQDADNDGDVDVVLHFKTQESGIKCGDNDAALIGRTFAGDTVKGMDDITVVKCPK